MDGWHLKVYPQLDLLANPVVFQISAEHCPGVQPPSLFHTWKGWAGRPESCCTPMDLCFAGLIRDKDSNTVNQDIKPAAP